MFSRTCSIFLLSSLLSTPLLCAAETTDPADQILPAALASEDAARCRELINQLGSADFDTRERAVAGLLKHGPAVLRLAAEFTTTDPEIARQLDALRQRMLLKYDGYYPPDPALTSALDQKFEGTLNAQSLRELEIYLKERYQITVAVDPQLGDPTVRHPLEAEKDVTFYSVRDVVSFYLTTRELSGLVRGSLFLITTPETAEKLTLQRHAFDWSSLALPRAEAARVAKAFTSFVPETSTELHASPEALSVRGTEESIRRCARLVALLRTGAGDQIFPMPRQTSSAEFSTLFERLEKPVSFALLSEEPLNVLAQLRKQGQEILIVDGSAPDQHAHSAPPFPRPVLGASPLRLTLSNVPMGLALKWVQRRARFPAEREAGLEFKMESGPAGRIQFRMQSKVASPLSIPLLGADATCLYARDAKPGEAADQAAKETLLRALSSHLALLPAIDPDRDVLVLNGRLFVQGPVATLERIRQLLAEWRAHNRPPTPAAWHVTLEQRLAQDITWDGRGLGPGKVLSVLRKLGQVNILLEDADGGAPAFQLNVKDAELLPPGTHKFGALLDQLAKVANASWSAEAGVIVVRPKTEKPPGSAR